jgi:hypothetical protein
MIADQLKDGADLHKHDALDLIAPDYINRGSAKRSVILARMPPAAQLECRL